MVMHMQDDRRDTHTVCGRKTEVMGEGEPCAACQKTQIARRNSRRTALRRDVQNAVLARHAGAVERKYNAACEAEGLDPEHEEVRSGG